MPLRNPLRPKIKKHQHSRDTTIIPVITITTIISTIVVVIVNVEVIEEGIVIITIRVTVNTVHHADITGKMMRVRQLEVEVERGKNRGSQGRTVGIGHERDEKKSNAVMGISKKCLVEMQIFY
jgi:hypothetical protein